MNNIVNKDTLFCDEYRALTLLEYPKELTLVKQLIELVASAVESNAPDTTWSHNGICHMFAKSIADYMKMSYEKHLKVAVEEGIQDVEGYAWRRLEKEVYDACQGLEYEINTLTNSRAEVPFITISIGLGTSKFAQMFQMQYLKNRQHGFDGRTPVFPKLVFITKKGLNLYPNDPQYYIFKEAIKRNENSVFSFTIISNRVSLSIFKSKSSYTSGAYSNKISLPATPISAAPRST